ncbi:MAG: D-alanyl-D-alanine carboxypeptidase [Chitinophagaceae bacterium]|nr:D-alanyl-D-alanine carboxypeptidase [Chitinophagaceae bacterium]
MAQGAGAQLTQKHFAMLSKHPFGFFVFLFLLFLKSSCSIEKQIGRLAKTKLLNDTALCAAHTGICIFDPDRNKYLYRYQSNKYFVPASNVKIPTCYAAMKYLGTRLPALQYAIQHDECLLKATGDPTFLHPDFPHQPAMDSLKNWAGRYSLRLITSTWKDKHWGSGWSWDDYDAAYMAEKSPWPAYGNLARFAFEYGKWNIVPPLPEFFPKPNPSVKNYLFTVERQLETNQFFLRPSTETFRPQSLPFRTQGFQTTAAILNMLLTPRRSVELLPDTTEIFQTFQTLYSQPVDSLLRPFMHRSDNFYGEQILLMVSQSLFGVMQSGKVIDTLLKTDFSDLPQPPRWADGSGLSRYKLFTPESMAAILHKMEKAFSMQRIRAIFPTGGQGTLSQFYKEEAGHIYAKTGTLSGVVALSGFLYTAKNRRLIFSVMVNHHRSQANEVRRAIERFLRQVRKKG